MPGQYLLRYETRWALRFLTRWPSILWLFAPILYMSAIRLFRILIDYPDVLSPVILIILKIMPEMYLCTIAALWMWLMQYRTFVMFSSHRLQDLVLTRFESRHFWPALLAAPVLVPSILIALTFLGLMLRDFLHLFHACWSHQFREVIDFKLIRSVLSEAISCVVPFYIMVLVLLIQVAFTADVAFKCHRHPTIPRILLRLACLVPLLPLCISLFMAILIFSYEALHIHIAIPATIGAVFAPVALLTWIRRSIRRLRDIYMPDILQSKIEPNAWLF